MIKLTETQCQKNRLEDRQRKEFLKLEIHQLVVQAEYGSMQYGNLIANVNQVIRL